ncbi:MAG: DUF1028 domain-containing protein [Candidatus Hodarchaeales archaeon]|jgi:uncharacterized Ntn-hydrolase superfamily protein
MALKKYLTISNRPVHTYSIVARDPKTGEMGVGVQSHWFSVGSVVSWGEAGVGVVATQSFINKSFGLRGLELLKQEKSPQEALKFLLSDDEGKDIRQVAILDKEGRVATHTGTKCIKHAGHRVGYNFSVQANMMLTDEVWTAMAEAFQNNTELRLPERIIKSLEAAESAGGDIRGKQSAALLVVEGEAPKKKWEDPLIDLRIADHEEPLNELNRLMRLWRAYELMNIADRSMEQGNMERALKEYNAAQTMCPDNLEMKYWTAVSLANTNNITQALELFKEVFKKDENWRRLTERLPEVDLLKVREEEFKRILKATH